MRNKHPSSAHFCVANKLVRDGRNVYEQPLPGVEVKVETFPSVNRAKHFMRTGRRDMKPMVKHRPYVKRVVKAVNPAPQMPIDLAVAIATAIIVRKTRRVS